MQRVTSKDVEESLLRTTINIKNVCFGVNTNFQEIKIQKYTWHFVCIISTGCFVLSSDILMDEENGILKCRQEFNFGKITGDVDVNVSFYAIAVKNKKASIYLLLKIIWYNFELRNW